MNCAVKNLVREPMNSCRRLDPERWGIPCRYSKIIQSQFDDFYWKFRPCFETKTCNNCYYGFTYIKGLFIMESKRNFANITRRMEGIYEPPDGLQHFMSDSPWSSQAVYDEIQRQIADDEFYNGGFLIVDASGEKRNSENCAGASRQRWGRVGKIEVIQNAIALGYHNHRICTMISSELYMAEKIFKPESAELRKKTGIPEDRKFLTRTQLAFGQVKRAVENGVKFEVFLGDADYGRDGDFRKNLDDLNLTYLLDTSTDATVYLREPFFKPPRGEVRKNVRYHRPPTVDGQKPVKVRDLPGRPDFQYKRLQIRHTERGILENDFWSRRVWTLTAENELREEWLLIRRQNNGKVSYSFGNAPANTSLETLARWRCYRYYVERVFQDNKSQLGWDELEARKYRSWEHHTALTALASWFITSLKLKLLKEYPADPELAKEMEVEVLPMISHANVRELFRSAFSMGILSKKDSRNLVTQHLFNRARSTSSWLKKQKRSKNPRTDHGDSS